MVLRALSGRGRCSKYVYLGCTSLFPREPLESQPLCANTSIVCQTLSHPTHHSSQLGSWGYREELTEFVQFLIMYGVNVCPPHTFLPTEDR